jgi:hypothetical protein
LILHGHERETPQHQTSRHFDALVASNGCIPPRLGMEIDESVNLKPGNHDKRYNIIQPMSW